MNTTIAEVAAFLDGKVLRGDSTTPLTGFAALDDATSRQLSFYANDKFAKQLEKTKAAAILVQDESINDMAMPEAVGVILVADAATAFDRIVAEFGFKPPEFVAGISSGAHVDPSCHFDESAVSVQPGAVLLKGVSVGEGSLIQSGAVIGESATIGKNCVIGPNVTIRENCIIGDRVIIHGNTTIGADGFGYEFDNGVHRKVDQMGIVRIESDVEIGASTTIDRARFGETVIGEGTKIDNQVQIGHNAILGKHCMIVAQCGISGSAKLGNYVTLAARVGIAGHIEIADQTTVGGKSGVIASITEPGGTYFGYPAKPMKETLRTRSQIKRLGSLLKRVTDLEKKLEALDVSQNSS